MNWILAITAVFSAWAMLSVVGNERQNAIAAYHRKLAEKEKAQEDQKSDNKSHG